ncbi:hypothetical protein FISHEDRAFT_51660 [Fistulina hepatica ATCC 64428]|uniref:Uncharacterized protein n=1 Tax=Fistulina hepatica ATCC 64428 TaxID=1128425 RepID=A0A0D7A3A5_9AGAR|nr:hypothetical protein FISHEDRAFT_51660 [Fistulina hepatica ATCC 64428]
MLLQTAFLLFPVLGALADHVQKGGNCSQGDSRLQAGTYAFWSDCDSVTYCSSSGACELKGCRKDDFPLGYAPSDKLPPKCERGSFCPDEEDQCLPVLPVGSACQLNRDDECEGPPNYKQLRDTTGYGLNVNGSVCLNNICMWANVTLGQACVVENTAYIAYGVSGEFIDIISRGNCQVGLYCDSQQLVCMSVKAVGESCDGDKECVSYNCLSSGVCGTSLAAPKHLAFWVYLLVGLAIFGGMFGTLYGLFIFHRKARDEERERRLQYWQEQNAYHQNLNQMKQTARHSIMSFPPEYFSSQRNSAVFYTDSRSDDSHFPILQPQLNKPSRLSQKLSDDGAGYYDEQGPSSSHR